MKKLFLIVGFWAVTCLVPLGGYGQDGLKMFGMNAGAKGMQQGSPVNLVRRADSVTLQLSVSSDERRPEVRARLLERAFAAIKKEAESRNNVTVRGGNVSLSLRESYLASASFGFNDSKFTITLLTPLAEDQTVFEQTMFLNRIVEVLELPKGVDVKIVGNEIALSDPSQYRREILEMIAEECRMMKEIFGQDIAVELKGLDQKVQLRQVDDVHFELSLPYEMTLTQGE